MIIRKPIKHYIKLKSRYFQNGEEISYCDIKPHIPLIEWYCNAKGYLFYGKDSNGFWEKREFDDRGKKIYWENSTGYWERSEYDNDGNKIYYENSKGEWTNWTHDNYNHVIYRENSRGYWYKKKYDNGKLIYYENSLGVIRDNR